VEDVSREVESEAPLPVPEVPAGEMNGQ